jgi:hypothetical protein
MNVFCHRFDTAVIQIGDFVVDFLCEFEAIIVSFLRDMDAKHKPLSLIFITFCKTNKTNVCFVSFLL